jgi:hypothetical protein
MKLHTIKTSLEQNHLLPIQAFGAYASKALSNRHIEALPEFR